MVGEAGFGPAKSVTTDLQSAPFGRSGIPPYNFAGAGERSRTINLLITNQLLCHWATPACWTLTIIAESFSIVNTFFEKNQSFLKNIFSSRSEAVFSLKNEYKRWGLPLILVLFCLLCRKSFLKTFFHNRYASFVLVKRTCFFIAFYHGGGKSHTYNWLNTFFML